MRSKSELYVYGSNFAYRNNVLGALITITGHSSAFLESLDVYTMNYASTGGIIFASYAEAVTLKDSHFYKIEGLGGPPIDIRSTA